MSLEADNPFEPPKAGIGRSEQDGASTSGSLEDALAGRVDIDIGNILREAWGLTHGAKLPLWGALVVVMAASLSLSHVFGKLVGSSNSVVLELLASSLAGIALYPITGGVMMISLHRAVGLPISFGMVFGFLHLAVPLILGGILVTLAIYAGLAALVLPGIFLSIATTMTLPLIVERRLRPWEAFVTSIKAVSKRWFEVFGLLLVTALLVGLSGLPLGIGLIWTVPWSMLVFGVLYRRMFGVQSLGAPSGSLAPSEERH